MPPVFPCVTGIGCGRPAGLESKSGGTRRSLDEAAAAVAAAGPAPAAAAASVAVVSQR